MNKITLCALMLLNASLVMAGHDGQDATAGNQQQEWSKSNMDQLKQFTLEDLNFGGNNYRNMVAETRGYAWWGDQLIRRTASEVLLVDKARNTETSLFSVADLHNVDMTQAVRDRLSLRYCTFPYADQPYALIRLGNRRILFDVKKKREVWSQLNKGTLQWNKTSRNDAYLDADNLYLRLADGTERQLSTDGSREIVYGQSVHRNEFGIDGGIFWSADGMKVAFYRMDQSMVTDYPQVNTFKRVAELEPDKYPMAGMTSHEVQVGIHDIKANKTIYLNTGDPKDRYFTNIAWAPDGTKVYLYEVNRAQNVATLDEYDAQTGNKLRTLDTETDSKYVEPQHPITFLPWDSTKFLAWSQKDGYWHLYLYDVSSGEQLKQVTQGEWVVMDLLGFNAENHTVIVKGNKHHALTHNLLAVNLDRGTVTQLDDAQGVHFGTLSATGRYLIDDWNAPDVPRAYALTDVRKALKSGWSKSRTELFASKDPWAGYAVPTFRQGSIKAADNATDLYYRMVLPPDFDETKKYPTIVYVYGGPHANNVQASWHQYSRSWETYMAQRGYVLFILDNRGSQHRGKEFEQVTFHQLGQVEMQDQMKGVEYLRSLPYVDTDRLGVHGWSYGGYMTISLMTNYPDVFKVGVAGGPVIDWRWYEVMYGERYMGTPESNAEGYAKTSLISKAKDLKGRLQIIIGANDPTVVPQHAMEFISECNKVGTQPDYYLYPGEGHNMKGHLSVHLHERITRYFDDFLK